MFTNYSTHTCTSYPCIYLNAAVAVLKLLMDSGELGTRALAAQKHVDTGHKPYRGFAIIPLRNMEAGLAPETAR